MLGEKLLRGDKQDLEVQSLCGEGKIVALYFSGYWCPPCHDYTQELAEWYAKFKAGKNGAQFEVVFVSHDKNVAAFNEHYAPMPWPALPYAEREKKVREAFYRSPTHP